MTKHFCDICKKEFEKNELFEMMVPGIMNLNHVCDTCIRKVENFVKKITKEA